MMISSNIKSKIVDYYPVRIKNGIFGVEIEGEFQDRPLLINNREWTTKNDSSLRGYAAEYVFKKPLDNISKPLRYIEKAIKDGPKVEESIRTSVHVHLNVQQENPFDIHRFMTVYWLCENSLLKFCEDHRQSNLFCLPVRKAETPVRMMKKDYEDNYYNLHGCQTDAVRYAGCNLASINKFGSLEFRALEGTFDSNRINMWAQNFKWLYNKSKSYKHPADVMDRCFQMDGEDFIKANFHPSMYEQLRGFNHNELVSDNIPIVIDYAYDNDWDKVVTYMEEMEEKPPNKTKEVKRPRLEHAGWTFTNASTDTGTIAWNNGNVTLQPVPEERPMTAQEIEERDRLAREEINRMLNTRRQE